MKARAKGRLRATAPALIATFLVASACVREQLPQNTLDPAGPVAEQQASLFWIVFWIATGVFVLVEGVLIVAMVRYRHRRGRDVPTQVHGNRRLEIAWTVAPALLLAGVAVPTVATIFNLSERPAGDMLRIEVTGRQWWWEVNYPDQKVVTANEIHIPTQTPVFVEIESADVLHSFWIPRLAGKQDLEPGRKHHLTLEADRPGTYLGQCAEFCGLSHANMRMRLVAHPAQEFDAWIQEQKQKAVEPTDPLAAEGARLFAEGRFAGGQQCGACHTVDPTIGGTVGPNLAHFGSRTTLAAGMFRLDRENLQAWLDDPPGLKPGADMPDLGLTPEQIDALVAYLESLK